MKENSKAKNSKGVKMKENSKGNSSNLANFGSNLKAIFALPKWAKIFLVALTALAAVGLGAAFSLKIWASDKIEVGEIVLKGIDRGEQTRILRAENVAEQDIKAFLQGAQNSVVPSKFAYQNRLYFQRLDFLLRSKVIAYIDIQGISWASGVDKNAVSDISSHNRWVKFATTQDLISQGFNEKNLGKVEYKMDFSPFVETIVKYYAIFLVLLIFLAKVKSFTTMPFGKFDYALGFVLTLVVLFVCLGKIDSGHNWGGDFSQYIAEAISIVNGTTHEQVANNTIMMDKIDGQYGPYHYPWGFALLLAPIYAIFGFNLIAFKFVGIVSFALFVGVFYLFCAKRMPRIYALCVSLFFALNPHLTSFASENIVSDMPFLLFAFVAILSLGVLFDDKNRKSANFAYFFAIFGGGAMGFASCIRTNGLVILCALLCVHFVFLARNFMDKIPKKFTQNIFAKATESLLQIFKNLHSPYNFKVHILIYLAFGLVYGAINALLPSGEGNVHLQVIMGANLNSVLYNLDYYVLTLSEFFSEKNGGGLALLVLCMPLVWLGIKQSVAQNAKHIFFVLCLLGSFVLIILWPALQGLRYAFVLLPFLVFYAAFGLVHLCGKGAKQGIFMGVLFALVLINFASKTINNTQISLTPRPSTHGAYTKEAKEAWEFIKQNTPHNAMIISFKPRVTYLNTHRLGFASSNVRRLDEADFVLITKDDYNMPNPNSAEFKAKTKLAFTNGDFSVYEVIK